MDFHLVFTPKPFKIKINHHQKLLLIGSCFTENMGAKLKLHKFSVLDNPNGILFNPISITKSIASYITNKKYNEADLFSPLLVFPFLLPLLLQNPETPQLVLCVTL